MYKLTAIICLMLLIINKSYSSIYNDNFYSKGIYNTQPYGLYFGDADPVNFNIKSDIRSNNLQDNNSIGEMVRKEALIKAMTPAELSNDIRDSMEKAYENGDIKAAGEYILLTDEAKRRAINYKNIIVSAAKNIESNTLGLMENIKEAKTAEVIVLFIDFSTVEKSGYSRQSEGNIKELNKRGWQCHVIYQKMADRYLIDTSILDNSINLTLDSDGVLSSAFGIKSRPALAVYMPDGIFFSVVYEDSFQGIDSIENSAAEFYVNKMNGVDYPVLKKKNTYMDPSDE